MFTVFVPIVTYTTSESGYHCPPEDTATPEQSHKEKTARSKYPQSPLFRPITPVGPKNIILFGETGIGKSSLINMLSGNEVARVSNDATGCTFGALDHLITIGDAEYHIWDTAGLNEGEAGSVPGDEALHHLRDLVEKLKDGLSLLIYCIRGSRYRDILQVNYDLFTQIICERAVPVVIVVTGLENEELREDWWRDNSEDFSKRKMEFGGHACITTTRGKKDKNGVHVFETEYNESKYEVQKLIGECCPDGAWVVDSEVWLSRIADNMADYYERYNTRSSSSGIVSSTLLKFLHFGMLIRPYNQSRKCLKKIRSKISTLINL